MTMDTDFERTLRTWLREDAREDPSRVLARVEAAVVSGPRPHPWRMRWFGSALTRRPMAAIGLALAVGAVALVLIVPAVLVGPEPTESPPPSIPPSAPATPTPRPAETAAPTIDPAAPALANDEPCTRTGALDATPPANPFHHDDLERMVLSRDDVGGLPTAYEIDTVEQGYRDNAELFGVEADPKGTCRDIARLGRIEGYANTYSTFDGRVAIFAVHLFWTEAEAAEWSRLFVEGLTAEADASNGRITMRVDQNALGVTDSILIHRDDSGSVRDWAIFERGPIVAWVEDVRTQDAPTFDVPGAAVQMADRIDKVATEVAARPPSGLDVAHLLSAPLPNAAYGDLAAGFTWDAFFGGCQDTAERGFIAGEQARADAIRFGRLTGCTAMYVPPVTKDVVRVFSNVSVYRDIAGAADALDANVADQESHGGVRFDAAGLGDEAVGVATPARGLAEGSPADTRVLIRKGNLLLWVSIQGAAAPDQQQFVLDLAGQLDARVAALID